LGAEHRGTKNGLAFDLGAFDLDGTVLRRNLRITQGTFSALQSLRERGMKLVVATGRRFESARECAERLGFADHDPLICYGGSMVRRISGETLLHRKLPVSLGIEVLEWAAARDLHARVFLDGRIITPPDTPVARPESDASIVDSPADWLREGTEQPTKLVIVDRPDDIGGWLGEAQTAFAGRLFVTRSLPHYVEVGGLEGTKSTALKFLCRRWGIDPERVLAFGDADNDIDMLRFAGRGLARGPVEVVAAMVVGNLVIYALGATWLGVFTGQGAEFALVNGVLPFLAGDAVKIALAAAVLPTLWKVVGGRDGA
jgi:Cof subfamily protein (haloacid dehalogenase superfamily)